MPLPERTKRITFESVEDGKEYYVVFKRIVSLGYSKFVELFGEDKDLTTHQQQDDRLKELFVALVEEWNLEDYEGKKLPLPTDDALVCGQVIAGYAEVILLAIMKDLFEWKSGGLPLVTEKNRGSTNSSSLVEEEVSVESPISSGTPT
jgi:hypothetical protein